MLHERGRAGLVDPVSIIEPYGKPCSLYPCLLVSLCLWLPCLAWIAILVRVPWALTRIDAMRCQCHAMPGLSCSAAQHSASVVVAITDAVRCCRLSLHTLPTCLVPCSVPSASYCASWSAGGFLRWMDRETIYWRTPHALH